MKPYVVISQRSWGFHRGSLLSPLVNVIWRTLLVILQARLRTRRGQALDPSAVSRIRLTTLPTDLDASFTSAPDAPPERA